MTPDLSRLRARASTLMQQARRIGTAGPDPSELAATALRTVSHEQLAPYLTRLVPEVPLFGARSDAILISARADAVAFEAGTPVAAFDWKSDVAPTSEDHEAYASQLLEYLTLIGIDNGAIVYRTSNDVRWVRRGSDS